MPRQSLIAKISLVLLASVLVGCDSGSSRVDRQPGTRPAVETPTSSPAETQPATKPAEPEIPAYFKIVERLDPGKTVRFQSHIESGNRLVIQTRNVRRLRIDRDDLPLAGDKRVILQLDDQGIEWTASSPVVEFERSLTGVWQPIKPEPAPVPGEKSEKP